MKDKLLIATIVKPQGIRGEVKVKSFCDTPDDMKAYKRVEIDGKEYKLMRVRPQPQDCAFLTLSGIADRNQAELLRGKDVYAYREDTPTLPEGRYFIVDIIGCTVVDEEGVEMGEITDVIPAKTDIYTIQMGKKEIMFVGTEGVILEIDVENSRMTVNRKRFMEVAVL